MKNPQSKISLKNPPQTQISFFKIPTSISWPLPQILPLLNHRGRDVKFPHTQTKYLSLNPVSAGPISFRSSPSYFTPGPRY